MLAGWRWAGTVVAVPELPEVETVAAALAPELAGRRVMTVAAHPSERFSGADRAAGATLGGLRRRGKYLIVRLSGGRELIVHLGMTGQLRLLGQASGDPYVRVAGGLSTTAGCSS